MIILVHLISMKFGETKPFILLNSNETEWPSLLTSQSCTFVKEDLSKNVGNEIQAKATVKKTPARLVPYVRQKTQQIQIKEEKAVAGIEEEFKLMSVAESKMDTQQKNDFLPDSTKNACGRDEMRKEQSKSRSSQKEEYHNYSRLHNPREKHQRLQRQEYSTYVFRKDSSQFQEEERTRQTHFTKPARYQKPKSLKEDDTDSDTGNDSDTKEKAEVNYRDFSGLELQTKIDEFLERSVFRRKLKAKRDKNLAKHLIIKFIRMRRSEEEVILMRRDINFLTNLIQSGFIGDNRGVFLYVIFLFFGKDVFKLDHSATSSDTSASNPETQSFPFDINEIQNSIEEWRKQKMEYATIKDAFDFLVQCKDKCDEKIVREHDDLFELRFKFKMLEGLVFFFDKTKK